ncbi:hypothetical protein [Sorangium sp. So ce362]|uniref:hypothetical protein n=1 Tax=Sorangium sp. So ce362 TaxID=3133303 RepID=UPI003F6145B5
MLLAALVPAGSIVAFSGADPANHPCASRLLLRAHRAVYEHRAPVGAAFEASPVALTDTVEGQGESIAYEAEGSGYFTMTEREAAPYPLERVARPQGASARTTLKRPAARRTAADGPPITAP